MSSRVGTTQEAKKDDDARIIDKNEKDMLIELETGIGNGEHDRLPGMQKEYSGWDVYNNEAKKVDTELVNDWRASLNSLLLFASIFAAVLTGFIIESKKLLEQDSSDAILDVMIFVANNLVNGTQTSYSGPKFELKPYAINVNCLLFASLSASLVAALASVVALQWVADYDAAITRGGSSPEDRAKRRQFRYAGVVWWKMTEIIAALPLLLYSSVFLFFGGLTLWMFSIHQTVGSVVAGGTGIAGLFYVITTVLSVTFVSAPFRTPLSRFIYSTMYLFFTIVVSLGRLVPIPASQAWLKERHQRYTGAVKRDDDEVGRRLSLGIDALAWLASHLSISLDSYDRLLLLVNELRKQDQRRFTTSSFNEAPWFSIFDLLAWRNLVTAEPDQQISKDETRAVAILAHCYRAPTIYAIIRPGKSIPYCWDNKVEEYWSQHCDISRVQWSPPSPSTTLNSLFLLLRDIPLPSNDTARQVEFAVRLSRWRNSPKSVPEPLRGGAYGVTVPPASSGTSVGVAAQLLRQREAELWFNPDCSPLYRATVGRVADLCIRNGKGITPLLLDALRWRFEEIVLGKEGHGMDAMSCLSRPLLYRRALPRPSSVLHRVHDDFTLLLARNINSFYGVERGRRVKELITMMWVSGFGSFSGDTIREIQGMENFFDANRSLLLKWFHNLRSIPHIHEILEPLALAQDKQPSIGSLWRDNTTHANISGLSSVLMEFNDVIDRGVTPEQHCVLIDLVCQDIELCPPGAFRADHGTEAFPFIDASIDKCLTFIIKFAAGAGVEFVNDASSFKRSWIRIARHLMEHYKGTDSPNILKLQASAWFLAPGQTLCRKALREPQALTWLKRIFEYPVKCQRKDHGIGNDHLLLHILEHVHFRNFPVNIPALTNFPIQGHYMNSLLAALILSDGYEESLRDSMQKQKIDGRCTNQLCEMISMIKSSQYSMLATLSATRLLEGYPDDLVGFSICVNKALDLPDDTRVKPLIFPLLSRLQVLINSSNGGSVSEQAIARREATTTIHRLNAILCFSSRTNSHMACFRASGSLTPAVGWFPPYVE